MAPPRADMPALTGIRGIAAWLVVLYHVRLSAGAYLPPEAMAVLARGYLAVDLFFMLSGFVLWLNYSDRMRAEGLATMPAFIGRRIARIWPLHAVMLAVAIGFALLLLALGKPVTEPWRVLPLHLLLVHNWGFTDQLAWNDPSWSISGEFAAYLVFPLIAIAVDWRRLPPALLIAAIALLAAALHLAMTAGGATLLDHSIPRLGIFRALFEFVIGTIVCALWMHWRDGRRRALIVAAPLALLFAALAGPTLGETAIAPLLLAVLLFVVAATADRRGNPLASRPIHYLGLISYSTYLVHFLLYRFFKIAFVDDGGAIDPPLLLLFLLLTLAASVLLFHGVERPAQRALGRRIETALQRRRSRGAGVAPVPAVPERSLETGA